MKTLNLISLSAAFAASAFATQPATSTTSSEVIELAPYVIEATRTPSAAELTQSGLDELKSAATTAPRRVNVSPVLTQPAPARTGEQLAGRTAQVASATPVSFAKAATPAARPRI